MLINLGLKGIRIQYNTDPDFVSALGSFRIQQAIHKADPDEQQTLKMWSHNDKGFITIKVLLFGVNDIAETKFGL